MLRDLIIFLAGAEFFHTLSHIILAYSVNFPLEMKFITVTSTLNLWAIIINLIITIILLWLAVRLPKKSSR